jgi:zinc protease
MVPMEDARSLHSVLLRPDQATLVVVGDVDPEHVDAAVAKSFADVTVRGPGLPRVMDPPPERSSPGVALIRHRGIAQRAGCVFARGPAVAGEDADALQVIDTIVAGPGERLTGEIRGEMGATYAISAFRHRLRSASVSTFSASYDKEKSIAGVRAVLDALGRLRAGDVGDDELRLARETLLAGWRENLATFEGTATLYATAIGVGDPLESVRDYPERIARIGRDQIARVASLYLAPERLHVLFVGDDRSFDPSQLGMGDVQVITLPK